ncbi:gamma-glutamyltransferase family protein [Henriciella mobilis]|uniref:Gamma-glutamyltransferase family protein n=1 Tax=Henriciella mobilis TaxID=2305467 RepID=A0A399RT17_9PROT|nr:gamma-glutamyltransferase family protein [Henriciella mobilis]RIJ33002.1 gamma-glutamyltransferase family protein [Henriciella mobilis]
MLQTPRAYRGMVTSPHHLASQAGLSVLQDGGNSVEACVAVAATLAVVYPHMTGIGGDGFWLVREPDDSVYSINACGAAGENVSTALYRDQQLEAIPWRGPLAAITPAGTISGWQAALARSGSTLPLSRLLRDAVHYARAGVSVTKGGAEVAASKDAELREVPGYSDVFRPGGAPLKDGQQLMQPALARTLERLCADGLESFYDGPLAADIAADLSEAGSPITAADLKNHSADQPEPLSLRIKGAELFNTAPPTQGLTSLMILALFDRLGADGVDEFDHVHGLVEATKQAFIRYREIGLGDPAFMSQDAQSQLDDSEQLDKLAQTIDRQNALPWPHRTAAGDTTWFGAVDHEGRVVSSIQSIYFEFGSGVVLPRTGIVWQNRGASFRLKPDGWNSLKPGRKPFHTLNPALAKFDDGRIMAYGTMGGEGQPQTQAAIFSRYARFGVPLQQAISAPRWLLGRTWGEQSVSLKLENRFPARLIEQLKEAGHDVEVLGSFETVMGHAGAVCRHADGLIEGATDPRSDGAVAAW